MTGIVFTRAWEDDRLDIAALAIKPGERVLCVAAAGDVPLALAAHGAGEVVAEELRRHDVDDGTQPLGNSGGDA